jgi:hypothetical protein
VIDYAEGVYWGDQVMGNWLQMRSEFARSCCGYISSGRGGAIDQCVQQQKE